MLYALVNAQFGFACGELTGKQSRFGAEMTEEPHYYDTPEDLAEAFSKISGIQRLSIVPALIRGDTFDVIEFTQDLSRIEKV